MLTKIYMVLGDNGAGNGGSTVFGLYPSRQLAEKRLCVLRALYAEEYEDGTEYMWISQVGVGPEGGDCSIPVEG